MNVLILFLTGLIAGFAVSQIQKTDVQGPNADITLGMMGALILGGFIAQFTQFSLVIIVISLVGSVLFVELGRSIPDPH